MKPSVTTHCIANDYCTNPDERIIEFSGRHGSGGGLISFRDDGGRTIVNLYRCDDLVEVQIPAAKIPPEQRHGKELLAALKEVVRISDRKHEAWDAAHLVIAKAEGRT